METISLILGGLSTALSLANLGYAFIGVFLGNAIGVLPGIGAMAAIAILLPLTYGMDPTSALVMLAGIYYGTQYGGAITSILLNLPGVVTHAVTCIDGYPLARQGKAGTALFIAMFASFVGSTIAILIMSFFSELIARYALNFGPWEYFSVMLLGLLAASTLARGSPIKGVAMVVIGLLLGTIGYDLQSGSPRFTFGFLPLQDGLSIVALAMGLFGITEVLRNVNRIGDTALQGRSVTFRTVRPEPGDIRKSALPMLRGSGLGAFFGVLPGTGATLASIMSYALEKRIARDPRRFGRGAIEGVAGPEAANNAGAVAAFIPTLTLGIPGDAVMALMLGALIIHGIQPGPQLVTSHPEVFWAVVGSFWIGNIMLVALNIPMISLWVRMLTIPYRLIYPCILFFICIGVFSIKNSLFDVGTVLTLGVVGFALMRLGFEPAPLLLGFILGPLIEENFRRAMLLSHGDMAVLVTRPISGAFMLASALLVVAVLYSRARLARARRRARQQL